MKHYICRFCGNLVAMINDTGKPLGCCSVKMSEVVPNSTEASREKHTPTISRTGNKVTVKVGEGEMAHPMTMEHMVNWVCLVTDKGSQRKNLLPGEAPVAVFYLDDNERVLNAFSYCNLHGLWLDGAVKG